MFRNYLPNNIFFFCRKTFHLGYLYFRLQPYFTFTIGFCYMNMGWLVALIAVKEKSETIQKKNCRHSFKVKLFFLKTINTNRTTTITTHPCFQLIIILINICTYRMSATGQRCHFLKVVGIDFVHIYKITGVASNKNELMIFG